MLTPDDRHLFLNALRPPEGYTFDSGIGTTFTLDLYTLLVTPLSLALFDRNSTEQALSDPLTLLESVRRFSSRLTIFCQAGRINLPQKSHPLLAYLESMVAEVNPPRSGVFHPKLWLLRYVATDKPTLYRLLNLSRNLTFDRSWDLMLSMEGELKERKVGFSRNRPLGDFLQALPTMTIHTISKAIADRVNSLQDEVRRVEFRPPMDFYDNFSFHPFGIPGYRQYQIKQSISRLMVVSPFLDNKFLNSIANQDQGNLLISRLESIDELNNTTRNKFEQILLMNEMAEEDPREATISLTDDSSDDGEKTIAPELSGLHAKLLVWENGWEAGWLIGSANATDAGFRKNVEFMIELHGKRSKIGIDSVLGSENDRNSFRSLLLGYQPTEQLPPIDQDQKRVEELANVVLGWLLNCQFTLSVQPNGDHYDLLMQSSQTVSRPDGIYIIKCRPISLREEASKAINMSRPKLDIYFEGISAVSLTAFIGFEVNALVGKAKHTIRFVSLLPFPDLPAERDDLILASILSNHAQFLQYLRLILMDETDIDYSGIWKISPTGNDTSHTGGENIEMPLLEELVHALSRSNDPGGKIDRIKDLVERLHRTEGGEDIIPEEFDNLWKIILQARSGIL